MESGTTPGKGFKSISRIDISHDRAQGTREVLTSVFPLPSVAMRLI